MIDPPACMLLGWFGIALVISWTGLFRGPQGQRLRGYESALAALSWPYVLVVMLALFTLVGAAMGIHWWITRGNNA